MSDEDPTQDEENLPEKAETDLDTTDEDELVDAEPGAGEEAGTADDEETTEDASTPDADESSDEETDGRSPPDHKSDRPSRWQATEDGTPPEADPEVLSEQLLAGMAATHHMDEVEDRRTVDTLNEVDDDEFFGTNPGDERSVVTRYDLEKAVPMEKKEHFEEVQRYWVNRPYAFISIFHSRKENEKKYYVIEPYQTEIEEDVTEFFAKKLKASIKYDSGEIAIEGTDEARREVIRDEARKLLDRYNLADIDKLDDPDEESIIDAIMKVFKDEEDSDYLQDLSFDGIAARPEPALIEENSHRLKPYEVKKLLYYLTRDFIGFERIDPIKHDINVEDISCDGYNSPVFVYHSDYEQIISNVYHGRGDLDDFVVKLAQRSGKGISKRNPQVDCTLPDGSRAQLTLGGEVSDHGTNYTIRQFKDVPFTPVDLINWKTFGLTQMAFLWLCIENHKSLIFAGGTASGKTTSLNAVSLFIPSNAKVVSIEDTREVELPQRNWIASVTRPSFSGEKGDIDEFALLEAALRQRPDYIVQGEVRGEEGRTLFQVMSTGHTTYTTFHADSVGEVLKRFTTDPINVSKTLFTALDLVSIQTATRVRGNKVRRNKTLTEVNHYDPENDEINVQDIYEWRAEEDDFFALGQDDTVRGTATLEEIRFDRGWTQEEVWQELKKRELVIAYLIDRGLNTYTEVAATVQAFLNDQETVLALIANDALEESLEDLREMESVLIDIDPEKEALVPRPDPTDDVQEKVDATLDEWWKLVEPYEGIDPDSVIADTLPNASDIAGEEITVDVGGDDSDEDEESSEGGRGEGR